MTLAFWSLPKSPHSITTPS